MQSQAQCIVHCVSWSREQKIYNLMAFLPFSRLSVNGLRCLINRDGQFVFGRWANCGVDFGNNITTIDSYFVAVFLIFTPIQCEKIVIIMITNAVNVGRTVEWYICSDTEAKIYARLLTSFLITIYTLLFHYFIAAYNFAFIISPAWHKFLLNFE